MKRLFTALLLVVAVQAEPRTFTDQFGRTITAELIAVDGDQIRIRRDDGQVFTLAPSKLTQDDQKYIQAWVAARPAAAAPAEDPKVKAAPDPKKIMVNLSRGKFASRTLTKFEGYTHKHEDWGYSIQVMNNQIRALPKLRIEYNLFTRTYSDVSSPTLLTGSKEIEVIPSRGDTVMRTGTTEVCKRRDVYFGNSGGEMRGIWLRIYSEGELIIEQASPESLMTGEKWTKPVN